MVLGVYPLYFGRIFAFKKEGESLPPGSHFIAHTPPSPKGKPLKSQLWQNLCFSATKSEYKKSVTIDIGSDPEGGKTHEVSFERDDMLL